LMSHTDRTGEAFKNWLNSVNRNVSDSMERFEKEEFLQYCKKLRILF